MTKRHYHHGELRDALLGAAETLVRERGAASWSLREASARVGVSPSAAYHHFASRDALMAALSSRVLARLGERMSEAAEEPDGPVADHQRRLVAVGRTYVRWAVEDPAVARLAFGAGSTAPGPAISPHPHDVLDHELDRLVDSGVLAESARPGAEFVVWVALHGLATLLVDGLMTLDSPDSPDSSGSSGSSDDAQVVDRETERVVRAVLGGLAQEATPPSPWPTVRSSHTRRRDRPGEG